MSREKIKWFDPLKIISHNCIFNLIVGERGLGKTYGSLKLSLRRFEQGKGQFIYLRDTEETLKLVRPSIFNEINKTEKFPIYAEGNAFKRRITEENEEGEEEIISTETVGFNYALSGVHKLKSASFSDVTMIIFDEFINENGSYIANFATSLLQFYETVSRLYEHKVYLFALANSITFFNPLFLMFRIPPLRANEYWKHKSGHLLAHWFSSKTFRDEKAKTPFYELLKETEYGAFMFENKAILDNDDLLEKLPVNSTLRLQFRCREQLFGIYIKSFYVYLKLQKAPAITLPVSNLDQIFTGDNFNLAQKNPALLAITNAARRGTLRFCDMHAKKAAEFLIFKK